MMKTALRTILLLLLLGFIVESALHLKEYIESFQEQAAGATAKETFKDIRVLVLCDSIICANDTKRDFLNLLRDDLMKGFSQKREIRFIRLYRPSIRTHDILNEIDEFLELYNPDIVLFMAGKSDFILQSNDRKSGIKILNLFNLTKRKLQKVAHENFLQFQRFLYSLGLLKFQNLSLDAKFGVYYTYAFSDYDRCIKYGKILIQKILSISDLDLRYIPIEELLYSHSICFYKAEKEIEGVNYFEGLLDKTPVRVMAASILFYFYRSSGRIKESRELLEQFENIDKGIIKARLDSVSQDSSTRIKEILNNFRLLGRVRVFPELEQTRENIQKIIDRIQKLKRNIPIVFMQYPSDSIEGMSSIISDRHTEKVLLFDSHQVFLQAARKQALLSRFFQEDWSHLSDEGKILLAKALGQFLRRNNVVPE